jgi:hypothetical protein
VIEDLPAKKRFTEGELARAINKHISTIVRWTRNGVHGRVLRSYLLGGRRYVDRQDFLAFVQAINEDRATPAQPAQDEDRLRRVNVELDRAGI